MAWKSQPDVKAPRFFSMDLEYKAIFQDMFHRAKNIQWQEQTYASIYIRIAQHCSSHPLLFWSSFFSNHDTEFWDWKPNHPSLRVLWQKKFPICWDLRSGFLNHRNHLNVEIPRKNTILWVETFSRDTLLQKPPAPSWWHQHHASTERLSLVGDGSRCLANGFNPTAVLASWVLWSRKTRPSQSLILILEPTDVGYTDGKRLYVCKYWDTYLNL